MAIRGRRLIQRYDLPLVYRNFEKDDQSDDPWDNGEAVVKKFTKVISKECTVQSPSRNNLAPEMQGIDLTNVFVVYTNTYIPEPTDGSDNLPAAFYLSNAWFSYDPNFPAQCGGWYKVLSVQQKLNRVINHYKVVIVKDNNISTGDYPDTTSFDDQIKTREQFLSESWEDLWLQ